MNYLIAFGYVITEDGYFPIDSDEYKKLIKDEELIKDED